MIDNHAINKLLSKWEIEFRKGYAKPLILLALQEGPNYPYNLTRVINIKTKGQINIAGSNIYPLLTSLNKAGLVSSEKIPREGTDSNKNKQLRTFYSLTSKGVVFTEALKKSMIDFMELIIQLSQEAET